MLEQAAVRIIESLGEQDREELCDALRTELQNGPNADKEVRFNPSSWGDVPPADAKEQVYTATPLSFGAFTAVHRPLTDAEVDRLRKQNSAADEASGYHVVDILPPESAFRRWPRSL